MANLFARGVHAAWLASLRRPTNRFLAAIRAPEATQARKLHALLARNSDTAYGREHSFHRVATPEQWQSVVPLSSPESVSPWVERIAAGESKVLTRDPVLTLEPTAGTSGSSRLVPYTQGLVDDLMAATGPWLFEIYHQWPQLLGTRSYWSASNAPRTSGKSPGGIPIGTQDDSAYFGPLEGWANARLTAATPDEDSAPTPRTPLERAQRLLQADDLGFFSVWSPEALLELLSLIEANFDEVLATLNPARITNIQGAIQSAGRLTLPALWPALTLISCWGEGTSKEARTRLEKAAPGVAIQPKGLLATEGVVTVPMGQVEGSLAAVGSHFLEFINLDTPNARPALVHEVQKDASYSPVLSTSGGLFRYKLGDIIHCVGHSAGTPRFVFKGRLAKATPSSEAPSCI